MKTRVKIATAVAALTAATGVAAVSANSSHPAAIAPTTLSLVGKETASAMLAPGGRENPVGTEFVTAERLFRHGKAIGHDGGSCQIVAPAPGRDRFTFHCTLAMHLPAGQIVLDGLGTFGERGPQSMPMAITGGTGRYRSARGQAIVTERRRETRIRLSIQR